MNLHGYEPSEEGMVIVCCCEYTCDKNNESHV